jgi:hypothetical protein
MVMNVTNTTIPWRLWIQLEVSTDAPFCTDTLFPLLEAEKRFREER